MSLIDDARAEQARKAQGAYPCKLSRFLDTLNDPLQAEAVELIAAGEFDSATKYRVLKPLGLSLNQSTLSRKLKAGCSCNGCASYPWSVPK